MGSVKSEISLLGPVFEEFGTDRENLISILQKAQEIYGYLPKDVIFYIAEKLSVSPAEVMGVATFYSRFRLSPMGKYLVQVCRGTACHVNGSGGITLAIEEFLGIKSGETTPEGLFTLEEAACLGCCSLAPVMMINGEAFGNLDAKKAVSVLSGIIRKEGEQCV